MYIGTGPTNYLRLSGILYAELINPNDSAIKKIEVKLTNGFCHAEFALPGKPNPTPTG